MVNGACFVRLARALPSTRAFALTGRGALRPPYPGCRSLRSLAPGYKQTRLRRVWDGLQPSPLTPKSARKPSCRTLHTSLRNSHGQPFATPSKVLSGPAGDNNKFYTFSVELPASAAAAQSELHFLSTAAANTMGLRLANIKLTGKK